MSDLDIVVKAVTKAAERVYEDVMDYVENIEPKYLVQLSVPSLIGYAIKFAVTHVQKEDEQQEQLHAQAEIARKKAEAEEARKKELLDRAQSNVHDTAVTRFSKPQEKEDQYVDSGTSAQRVMEPGASRSSLHVKPVENPESVLTAMDQATAVGARDLVSKQDFRGRDGKPLPLSVREALERAYAETYADNRAQNSREESPHSKRTTEQQRRELDKLDSYLV